MRIITCNVNGIRSAYRKGFWTWAARSGADVLCLQEVRAQAPQIPEPMQQPGKFQPYYALGERPGYGGVAIYSKLQPDKVVDQMGLEVMDKEGRYLQLDFGRLSVVSVYFPSGSSGEVRQNFKYEFLDHFMKRVKRLKKKSRSYVFCGDFNIAHKQIDIKNWRSNQKNSGFLPEERAWMDRLFNGAGYRDAFRLVDDREHQYTWWSNRGRAYENNVGWRIDYQVVSSELTDRVKRARIYKSKKFSDHAPLIIDYDFAGLH